MIDGLEFDERDHVYRHNGIIVPSVTQVLGLVVNRKWYTEESCWRGSAVHLACQYLDEGCLDWETVLPEHRGYVEAWRTFLSDSGAEVEATEEYVYHPNYNYAGRLDNRLRFPDKSRAIADKKTGPPHPATALQLAAYAMAQRAPRLYRRFAVRLKPDGRYTVTEYPQSDYPRDRARFITCLSGDTKHPLVQEMRREFHWEE